MLKRSLLFALPVFLFSCNPGTATRPVLLDGQIGNEEWGDAKEIVVDAQNRLLLKEDAHYYYLAIRSDLQKPLYTDMFIKISGQLTNVHASSQLGQRELEGNEWTDEAPATNWGKTKGWYANEVRFDRQKMRRLKEEGFEGNEYAVGYFPYDGLEFQFDKKEWSLEGARLRLEIRNMIGPEGFKDVIFPDDSERMDSGNWATLSFNE